MPKDYKGAYEKHMEKSGKTMTAAITVRPDLPVAITIRPDLPDDHAETYLWPLIRAPLPLPTSVSN